MAYLCIVPEHSVGSLFFCIDSAVEWIAKGSINHIVFSIVLYVWLSEQMHRREEERVKKTVLFVLAKVCKYFHSLWGVKAGIFMCSFYQSANMFGIYFGI